MPPSARNPQRAKSSGQSLLAAILFSLVLSVACGDEAYDQGIDAFNHGDYETAVTYFLAARPET